MKSRVASQHGAARRLTELKNCGISRQKPKLKPNVEAETAGETVDTLYNLEKRARLFDITPLLDRVNHVRS